MPGAGEQLLRVRAGAEPGDEEKGRSLVRPQREPAVVRLRRYLDRIRRRSRHEVQAAPRATRRLRLPHDVAEYDRRADTSQSNAGDPGNARGMRCLDARAMG